MPISSTAARTDVGRQREHNEDALLVLEDLGVLAVADGMGGLEHGEVASSTAIATLRAADTALTEIVGAVVEDPTRTNRSNLGSALEQLTDIASNRIQQVLNGANSGTTLVLGVIAGGHLLVANTGDSRAYLFREGRIRCLTDDHTVAAARLRAGLLTQEEHDVSPYQHMLYQALGTQGEVNPDLFDEPLAHGDVVMLCSDGLTGPVSEDELEALFGEHEELENLAGALVDAANEGGGPDNITVVLARWEDGPDAEEVERDRTTLKTSAATAPLEGIDLRLLRHFLDWVQLDEGATTDFDRGLHIVLTGALQRGDDVAGPGVAVGLRAFANETVEDAWTATEATTALVLSLESYEQLERRRPKAAARLMRGLLGVATL